MRPGLLLNARRTSYNFHQRRLSRWRGMAGFASVDTGKLRSTRLAGDLQGEKPSQRDLFLRLLRFFKYNVFSAGCVLDSAYSVLMYCCTTAVLVYRSVPGSFYGLERKALRGCQVFRRPEKNGVNTSPLC